MLSGLFPGQPRKKMSHFWLPFTKSCLSWEYIKHATSGMCSGELRVVDDTDSKAEAPTKTGSRGKSKNCSGDNFGLLVKSGSCLRLMSTFASPWDSPGETGCYKHLRQQLAVKHKLWAHPALPKSECSQTKEGGPLSYPQLCCPGQKAATALSWRSPAPLLDVRLPM